ncbi:tRNA (adenosine(37)-N6)-threonylcarbamoyltransferase complex dimerization subunit type 1 TsaB [Longispora urticae]
MLTLVIDTATAAVTAGVLEVGESVEVLAEKVTVNGKAHGELLAPSIRLALTEAGFVTKDLRAIVAGVGPGPFTGLRVGLVTATALGHALGIPTYAVGTLDALGHGTVGRLLVATDARRKELYYGVYADGVPVTGPSVAKPADISGDYEAAVGAGAHLYPLGVPVLDEPLYPSVRAFGELAAERIRSGAPDEKLTPLYLRRPDAVPPGAPKPPRA